MADIQADSAQVAGAGLEELVIKNASGDFAKVWGAVSAEGSPEIESIEVQGDDQTIAEFYTDQKETLSIEIASISFDVFQLITGNSYDEDSDGNVEIASGTDSEQNPPFIEVSSKSLAKKKDDSVGKIEKIWHRVQLQTPTIGQSNGDGVSVSMEGTAFKTDKDIEGSALTSSRVATIKFNITP